MALWRVEITSSEPTLLPFLITYPPLQKPEHTIIEEEGKYYLLSSNFESLSSYTEVDQYATKLLNRLNSLIKLQFGVQNGLTKTNRASYVDESGHKQTIVTVTTSAAIRFKIRANDDFFQDKARQQPDLIGKWLKEKQDPLVDEVLYYYEQQTNWTNLYKIYEIIKRDTGRAENNRILPRGTFDKLVQDKNNAANFDQSANDFNRSGYDARHSSAGSRSSEATTMSLGEAVDFITQLLIRWLDIRSRYKFPFD